MYCVTLGAEDSFLISYKGTDGQNHIQLHKLPYPLTAFLTHPSRLPHLPNISVSLGPHNASYYATDSVSYIWHGLPASLLAAYQSRLSDGIWTDPPRIVALGADSDWVLITAGDSAVWETSNYRILSQMLDFAKSRSGNSGGISEIKSLSLDAHRYQAFVATSTNGTLISSHLPPHTATAFTLVQEAVKADTEAAIRARRDRSTRNATATANLRGTVTVPARNATTSPETFRREWSTRVGQAREEVEMKMKMNLTLNLTTGGIARMMRGAGGAG